jgi:hypothetical protein
MDLALANVDLNSNPYSGTEHDTNKSLRDFALEMIMARRENRSQLAQIAWDLRRAVGPDGFHPELRKAVQNFIKFDVESVGGPAFGKSLLSGGKGSAPVCVVSPYDSGNLRGGRRKAELGSHSGQNRSGRRNHPQ